MILIIIFVGFFVCVGFFLKLYLLVIFVDFIFLVFVIRGVVIVDFDICVICWWDELWWWVIIVLFGLNLFICLYIFIL